MRSTSYFLSMLLLLVAYGASAQGNLADHFVTTWKTDNLGTSNSTSITIPTWGLGFNYDVDWDNDGVFDQLGVYGSVTHDFGVPGVYTIRIRGNFPRIYFSDGGDKEKILDVSQWGSNSWSSMVRAFYGCTNLDVTATDAPDLSAVTSTHRMFMGCPSLVGTNAFDSWTTDSITSMDFMFTAATSFNQPIGSWNVGKVSEMNNMFEGATSFNQNIENWDMSSVSDLTWMFNLATGFNQPVNSWDVSNATSMRNMFSGAASFNQPIGSWDVGNVTIMSYMFRGASAFDHPIENWDVSNVMYMQVMFRDADSFNQPIGSWDVGNVTNMRDMFRGAPTFDQPIENWDVSSVVNMDVMFGYTTNFDQDLSDWDLSSLVSASGMFFQANLSPVNYDSLLIGWERLDLGETQIPQNIGSFSMSNIKYCNGGSARDSLIIAHGWTIIDGGQDSSCVAPSCPEDVSGDGVVKYIGANNDRDLILQFIGGSNPTAVVPCSGCPEDINGDGVVKYTGANNDRELILQRIGGSIPTSVYICP